MSKTMVIARHGRSEELVETLDFQYSNGELHKLAAWDEADALALARKSPENADAKLSADAVYSIAEGLVAGWIIRKN